MYAFSREFWQFRQPFSVVVFRAVSPRSKQNNLRINFTHFPGILRGFGCVCRRRIGAIHMSQALLVAQGPIFDGIGLFKPTFCAHFTPFRIGSSIAIFYKLCACLRRIPAEIDRQIRFCTYQMA